MIMLLLDNFWLILFIRTGIAHYLLYGVNFRENCVYRTDVDYQYQTASYLTSL